MFGRSNGRAASQFMPQGAKDHREGKRHRGYGHNAWLVGSEGGNQPTSREGSLAGVK